MRDSFDTFYDEIENRLRKEGKLTTRNANDTKSDGANESLRLNNRKWFIRTYSLAEMRACRLTHKIILESVHMADIERFLLKSFDDVHLNLDTHNKMRELNINQPTPIQMQVIPLVISGYNVFGQSTTGTGKTLCFALPLIMMKLGRDPSFNGAVILVPTRELCQQIKSFLEHFVGVKSVFGGMTTKAGKPRCSKGANGEIYVATPGKLLQQLEKNNFVRDFSHLILDETDKMTSMEFIRNIRAVVEKMRDPRFCVLAATYFDSLQFRNLIKVDVSVFIGNKNAANEHVTQVIKLVDEKFAFVKEMIEKNILIFVNSKDGADELTMKLRNLFRYEYRTGYSNVSCSDWKRTAIVESLHAGKEQIDRNSIIERFNGGSIDILICTSLLSRGIDFKVDCVINYDCPHTVDDYIHRVGRTGRMRYGIPRNGMAYTLLEKSDRQYALNLYDFWMKSGVKLDDSILALVNE